MVQRFVTAIYFSLSVAMLAGFGGFDASDLEAQPAEVPPQATPTAPPDCGSDSQSVPLPLALCAGGASVPSPVSRTDSEEEQGSDRHELPSTKWHSRIRSASDQSLTGWEDMPPVLPPVLPPPALEESAEMDESLTGWEDMPPAIPPPPRQPAGGESTTEE